MTVSEFEGIDKKAKPERSLTEVLKKNGGRNSYGRITVRHHGGGSKKIYRIIDFKRDKRMSGNRPAPGVRSQPQRQHRSGRVRDGEQRLYHRSVGLKAGDVVIPAAAADIKPGNCLPIANIPVGTVIHNIELHLGRKALSSSAPPVSCAQLMAKEGAYAQIRMPSGECASSASTATPPSVRSAT